MPKPFATSIKAARAASVRLYANLADAVDAAEQSALVRQRDSASTLRAMLPHVNRMAALLAEIEASISRRRSLGDTSNDAR